MLSVDPKFCRRFFENHSILSNNLQSILCLRWKHKILLGISILSDFWNVAKMFSVNLDTIEESEEMGVFYKVLENGNIFGQSEEEHISALRPFGDALRM